MTAKSLLSVLTVIGGATVFTVLATANSATPAPSPLVKRGEYLVEKVGLCADCHSPRNERGEFIKESSFGGATLPFAPTVPMPAWAPVAPPIAGLPTMNDGQAVAFLTTGVRPDGSRPRPPMPDFRFSAEDARAVTAYLRSIAKK